MTIHWWTAVVAPNGEQTRESTGTADQRAAQYYEHQKRGTVARDWLNLRLQYRGKNTESADVTVTSQ